MEFGYYHQAAQALYHLSQQPLPSQVMHQVKSLHQMALQQRKRAFATAKAS